LEKRQNWNRVQKQINENDKNYRLTLKENEIRENEAKQKLVEAQWELEQLEKQHALELKRLDDEFERSKQLKQIEL